MYLFVMEGAVLLNLGCVVWTFQNSPTIESVCKICPPFTKEPLKLMEEDSTWYMSQILNNGTTGFCQLVHHFHCKVRASWCNRLSLDFPSKLTVGSMNDSSNFSKAVFFAGFEFHQ